MADASGPNRSRSLPGPAVTMVAGRMVATRCQLHPVVN
jgi:hypothetical protein